MSQQNRTTLGAIGLTLGLVALMLIILLTALHAVGVDDSLYFKLQTEAGILPEAGVSPHLGQFFRMYDALSS